MTTHIPERFRRELNQHVVLNHIDVETWPLVLGIFGLPGDGKSFQAKHHLSDLGLHIERVNAADLESDRAGMPAKLILQAYVDAGKRTEKGQPSVLLIDDVDTTVGEWENSTGTVNHQQILAQLMHLADSPTGDAQGELHRVPVIMTGNDLTKIYAPLRRSGRMRQFVWSPTDEERLQILKALFVGVIADELVERLAHRFPTAPVAFFTDVSAGLVLISGDGHLDDMAKQISAVVADPERSRAKLFKSLQRNKITETSIVEFADSEWMRREAALQSYLERQH